MIGKLRYLLGNMGWITISNFASKILVFLMVPYYTRALTTEGYGFYDLGYTMALLIAPLITLNTGEAIMRFAIVEKEEIKGYFSTAFLVSICGCVVAIVALVVAALTPVVTGDIELVVVGACLIVPANILYLVFSEFARGIDRVADMAIGGLINTVLLVALTILFVSGFGLGAFGCFCGTALSMFIASLIIGIRCRFWIYLVLPDFRKFRDLAAFGLPCSVNTLGWWANSALSRYATAIMLSVSDAGLLAAAYKIPAIPKAVQQVFIQAWQISSVKDFDPEDSDGFFSTIYETVGLLSAVLTSGVILAMPLVALVLFSDEFYLAWRYVPFLMACIVFDCLASILGGVFSAVGDTKPIAVSAIISLVVTSAACLTCIPLWGVQGACIASAASSATIWIARLVASKKYIKLRVNSRIFIAVFICIAAQIMFAILIDLGPLWFIVQAVMFVLTVVMSNVSVHYVRRLKKAVMMVSKDKRIQSE